MTDAPLEWVDEKRGPFGRTLRAVRMPLRISQSRLAERVDLDHSYISLLEAGSRQPSRDTVMRLAGALGLSDADRDHLLAAAGFLPLNGRQTVLDAEPALAAAVNLLGDGAIPTHLRDSFREQLFSLTAVYRLAAGVEAG